MASSPKKTLVLKSPVGAGSIVFDWPLKTAPRTLKGMNCYDEAEGLFSTIKFVCNEFPYLTDVLGPYFPVRYDQCNYKRMTALCDLYNETIDTIRSGQQGGPLNPQGPKPASKDLLRHILEQARHRAAVDPKKLNRVKGLFSPDTYGEWNFDYICEMLKVIELTEDDVLLDLGSGIGNVVLQLAGMTSVRECVGIEKGTGPYDYSLDMANQFNLLLKWYGKIPRSPSTLLQADFLDSSMKEVIERATVIFTNNLVFGSVNEELKQRFLSLREGTRILSTMEFRPLSQRFRISSRNWDQFESMLNLRKIDPTVDELSAYTCGVSWTTKEVPFFLHTVDRSALHSYVHQQGLLALARRQ